jgi:hypothetical protein
MTNKTETSVHAPETEKHVVVEYIGEGIGGRG